MVYVHVSKHNKSVKPALGNWSFGLYTDILMTTGRTMKSVKLELCNFPYQRQPGPILEIMIDK